LRRLESGAVIGVDEVLRAPIAVDGAARGAKFADFP
jgi:hypothetical protein